MNVSMSSTNVKLCLFEVLIIRLPYTNNISLFLSLSLSQPILILISLFIAVSLSFPLAVVSPPPSSGGLSRGSGGIHQEGFPGHRPGPPPPRVQANLAPSAERQPVNQPHLTCVTLFSLHLFSRKYNIGR